MRSEIAIPPVNPATVSIIRRGCAARETDERQGQFSRSLSAVSADPPSLEKAPRPGELRETGGGNRQSAPPSPSRIVEPVRTPFDTGPAVSGGDPDKSREWRDYFLTHAPAQWWTDETSRTMFSKIYGPQALVTLDWTCNVPENIDPNFVVHVPVDQSGKPIPRSLQS